jgi:hypothetical protein
LFFEDTVTSLLLSDERRDIGIGGLGEKEGGREGRRGREKVRDWREDSLSKREGGEGGGGEGGRSWDSWAGGRKLTSFTHRFLLCAAQQSWRTGFIVMAIYGGLLVLAVLYAIYCRR